MSRSVFLLILAATATLPALAGKPEIKRVPTPYVSPASGAGMYMSYCASCHGTSGQGDGPVATRLKVAVPDLTCLAKMNRGVFPSARVVQSIRGEGVVGAHGLEDMPVWGPVFQNFDGRKEAVVHMRVSNLTKHLESLQAK